MNFNNNIDIKGLSRYKNTVLNLQELLIGQLFMDSFSAIRTTKLFPGHVDSRFSILG